MRTLLLPLICYFGIVITAHAEVKLPALLQEVQTQYQKSTGVQAEFTQSTDIKATKQIKKAKGRIWIKRPNKLRWETLEPDPNILVSDGKTFWFYTPPFDKDERGQVIIKKSAQVQTQFLNALLSGSFDFEKGSTSIENRGPNAFLLKPKPGTAGDVRIAQITIDPSKHTISEVILTHTSGNQTTIKLQQINLNAKLDEGLFKFAPDRRTDILHE
jgi:outer membrane lipoprotein carrier protein